MNEQHKEYYFQEANLSIQSLQSSNLGGNSNNYMELLQRLLVGSLMATTEPSILSRTAGMASIPGIPSIPMNTAILTSPSNTSSPDSGLGAEVHQLPHENHNDILQRLARNLGASHLHTTRNTISNPTIANQAPLTQHLLSKTSIIGELHPGGVHQQRKSNEIFKFRVCSSHLFEDEEQGMNPDLSSGSSS